jgi:hypothetical protein
MGPGGYIFLTLFAVLVGYIFATEKPFKKNKASESGDPSYIPKTQVILEPAPQDMTQRLTPPWQAELIQKLQTEGYALLGDYSYSSTEFFWARMLLSPDKKSVFSVVNWLEAKGKGNQIISNVEVYSFDTKGSFLLTACAQDGATRLLTGATRPTEEQLSLHLKAVFNEISVRPLITEHQNRLSEREEKGTVFQDLLPADVLPNFSKILS